MTAEQGSELEEAQPKRRSRRALLAGALGGLGAWAAAAVSRTATADAAAGDPVVMGQVNDPEGTNTRLVGSFSATRIGAESVQAVSNGTNGGVYGQSRRFGVHGSGTVGVFGFSDRGQGVHGFSNYGDGVVGSTEAPGRYGGLFFGKVYTTHFYEMTEIRTPYAPEAHNARLFIREHSGKTQLCVKFSNGQVKVLAAET